MTRKRMKKVRKLDERRIYKVYVLRRTDKMDEHEPDKYQPLYFGKGKGNREFRHRSYALYTINKGGNRRLVYVMIYKLWREGFDFIEEVLYDNLTEAEAFEIEMSGIAFYGRMDIHTGILANHTDGGEGPSGAVWSEEARKNHIAAMTGFVFSLERNKKISDSKKGKPRSKETVEKVAAKKRGIPLSEEHKKKLSESEKGRIFPEEVKKKISIAKTGKKRAPFSEEWKQNMSKAQKLRQERKRAEQGEFNK